LARPPVAHARSGAARLAGYDGRRYPRGVQLLHRRPLNRLASLSLVLLLTLAVVALSAPAAPAATGGGNAFNELTESQSEAAKTATTATTSRVSTPESTNSQTVIILALAAAVLLLVGIAFVIARDARKVAPAGDPELTAGIASRDWAARQRKRRAKAKAARHQRKRNR
jgi:beta-lactamase regulating signal transducer with metallopeptidase domain